MIRPHDRVSERFLRLLCGFEKSERLPDQIDTHDGTWFREGKQFRFSAVPDDEWPHLPDFEAKVTITQPPAPQPDAHPHREQSQDRAGDDGR